MRDSRGYGGGELINLHQGPRVPVLLFSSTEVSLSVAEEMDVMGLRNHGSEGHKGSTKDVVEIVEYVVQVG